MSRMLGANEEVVGAGIGGMKIGGDVDDAFLLFPDPDGRDRLVARDRDRDLQDEGARASRGGS